MLAAHSDGQKNISILDMVFDELRQAAAGASKRKMESIIRQARRVIDDWATGKLDDARADERMAELDKRVASLVACARQRESRKGK